MAKIRKSLGSAKRAFQKFAFELSKSVPFLRIFSETHGTQTPIFLSTWFLQKVVGINARAYWPVHFTSIVTGEKNILCGIETCPGFSPGCYIQGIGKIYIGDYTQIAANVGIISANHEVHDNREHIESIVNIGKWCWIGMNSVILPGVTLGDFTIVGAGSVVTKSFSDGYCVVAGNPAKLIKTLDPEKCVKHTSPVPYNGYIRGDKFEHFRSKYLRV